MGCKIAFEVCRCSHTVEAWVGTVAVIVGAAEMAAGVAFASAAAVAAEAEAAEWRHCQSWWRLEGY